MTSLPPLAAGGAEQNPGSPRSSPGPAVLGCLARRQWPFALGWGEGNEAWFSKLRGLKMRGRGPNGMQGEQRAHQAEVILMTLGTTCL